MFTQLLLFCLCSQTVTGRPQSDDTAYLRGNLETPQGDDSCNPCVENVIEAVNTLRNHGETLGFNWGANYPEVKGSGTKNHWQGVQRLQLLARDVPTMVVTSSHQNRFLRPNGEIEEVDSPAHFAVVEMASRDRSFRRLRSNRLVFGMLTKNVAPDARDRIVTAQLITEEFSHPGGVQAIGKYLLVGSDGSINHSRDTAQFSIWDMSDPFAPRNLWAEPGWELPIKNANSVGITRLEDGRYLMLRALTDAKDLEFYILGDDLEENPDEYHDGMPWDRWNYKELQSELFNADSTLDLNWADLGNIFGDVGYQGTNLVTECGTGQIYLIASHGRRPQGFGGDDFVDAFRVDVPVERPDANEPGAGAVITKVAKRHMFPSGNANARQGDLQAAGGAYVSPDNKLYYYATEHGVTGEGGFVKMIEFGPQEAQTEVHFIEEAWVELYRDPDFKGRSIILDYLDRSLRDTDNFTIIEEFDDQTSSVIYALPAGYRLRLFSGIDGSEGYLNLVGTGSVSRVDDFSLLTFHNGESADDAISSAEWLAPVTTVEDESEAVAPAAFELYQNFPNPFNPETVINYRLDQTDEVRVAIYDIRGQLIKTLVQERQSPGFYSFKWEGTDALGNEVASGTYLYRLEVGEFIQVRKLTLLR